MNKKKCKCQVHQRTAASYKAELSDLCTKNHWLIDRQTEMIKRQRGDELTIEELLEQYDKFLTTRARACGETQE